MVWDTITKNSYYQAKVKGFRDSLQDFQSIFCTGTNFYAIIQ